MTKMKDSAILHANKFIWILPKGKFRDLCEWNMLQNNTNEIYLMATMWVRTQNSIMKAAL